MPRGGSRKHPTDCKCGNCPKPGRKKAERLTDNKVATRILAKIEVEKKWLKILDIEWERIIADPAKASTAAYKETLKYLENRSLGNCVDTVNHLHDKPIEHNVNLNLSERFRLAMQKAEERVRNSRKN